MFQTKPCEHIRICGLFVSIVDYADSWYLLSWIIRASVPWSSGSKLPARISKRLLVIVLVMLLVRGSLSRPWVSICRMLGCAVYIVLDTMIYYERTHVVPYDPCIYCSAISTHPGSPRIMQQFIRNTLCVIDPYRCDRVNWRLVRQETILASLGKDERRSVLGTLLVQPLLPPSCAPIRPTPLWTLDVLR